MVIHEEMILPLTQQWRRREWTTHLSILHCCFLIQIFDSCVCHLSARDYDKSRRDYEESLPYKTCDKLGFAWVMELSIETTTPEENKAYFICYLCCTQCVRFLPVHCLDLSGWILVCTLQHKDPKRIEVYIYYYICKKISSPSCDLVSKW